MKILFMVIFTILFYLSVTGQSGKRVNSRFVDVPYNPHINITRLNSVVNTDATEYAPCLSNDDRLLFFVSDGQLSVKNPDDNYNPSHDILFAVKDDPNDIQFARVFNPDHTMILNNTNNQGVFAISNDFKKLYFTECNRNDAYGSCDIYVADIKLEFPDLKISNIRNLGPNINTSKWEAQPSISPDNKILFFSSNQDGNNIDIYFSTYNSIKEEWNPCQKLPEPVNSSNFDGTPFICSDNRTLIFSSEGHYPSAGSSDFFYAKLESNGKFSEPINLGKPLNSEKEDIFITLSNDGEYGYFSSIRKDLENNNGSFDIYKFEMQSILDEVLTISWQQYNQANVEIFLFDYDGNQVNFYSFIDSKPGPHTINWDKIDEKGNLCKPGKYIYQVQIGKEKPELPRFLWIK